MVTKTTLKTIPMLMTCVRISLHDDNDNDNIYDNVDDGNDDETCVRPSSQMTCELAQQSR